MNKLEDLLAPARRRGFEYLDGDDITEAVRERSHKDIVRSSALFGGDRALRVSLRDLAPQLREVPLVLDVGCGRGESIPIARCALESQGKRPQFIALDLKPSLVRLAARYTAHCVAASAMALPFADASIDLAICSLVLHHFDGPALSTVLGELNRVARRVLIVDLRRSVVAAAGIWLASFPLGFHPYSRHDGVTSVLRGFTLAELQGTILQATGAAATVRGHAGFRISASWTDEEPTEAANSLALPVRL